MRPDMRRVSPAPGGGRTRAGGQGELLLRDSTDSILGDLGGIQWAA